MWQSLMRSCKSMPCQSFHCCWSFVNYKPINLYDLFNKLTGILFQVLIGLVVGLVIMQYCFSAVFEGHKLEPLFSIGRSQYISKSTFKIGSTSAGSLFERNRNQVEDSTNATNSSYAIIPKCPPVPPNLGNRITTAI